MASPESTTGLVQSPLHDRHVALGAKTAEFAGWEMPLEYTGVIAEHTAVREAVGVFDVSHLGKVEVRGEGAYELVNSCLSNDLDKIEPGRAQYTLCCEEDTAGIVDDLIVYLFARDHLLLVPNAANTAEVQRRLEAVAPDTVTITDQHRSHAVLAVQGPRSGDLLEALGMPTEGRYMSVAEHTLEDGSPVTVCRSGYTGEKGYELIAPAASAGLLWDTLMSAGADLGVVPCGLGARDTLRLEMGYPLHGQDLTRQTTAVSSGLSWAVGWKKPAFWGRDALLAEKETGARTRLAGLRASGRGVPRPHMPVVDGDVVLGEVTSGTFSPTLRTGVALARVDAAVEDGAEVTVDVRGRPLAVTVTKPPFVETHTA
ncbi:aminomethyltransferase [Marmoricola endophyticus]|uniref:Aminomethyltransferase n=1 Tax=Marmoricola endophyticus TaxID=2040280 RepID=A0A917EYK3_9ACTN|nr:glycine cleavage system aminomethyltransferase GcvT [Marmoricola endophyticus]GGF31119.1 aminomethyltransferase [Marmoricola endophyticus]